MASETVIDVKTEVKDIIRISLNHGWKVSDFILMFDSFQNLYDHYSCFEIINNVINLKQSEVALASEEKFLDALALLNKRVLNKGMSYFVSEKNSYFYQIEQEKGDKEVLLQPLVVKKITFSSPGITDIAGLGQIIGYIKEIIFRIMDFYVDKKMRKLDERRKEIENDLLELDRNKKFIEILQTLNYSSGDIRKIISYEMDNIIAIEELIEEEKISDIQ